MKKILHISNYYLYSNETVKVDPKDIVKALSDNYEHIIICFVYNEESSIEEVDNIKIYKVGYKFKIFNYVLSIKYKKILKTIINEFKPNYIHFHYPNPFVARYLLKILKNHSEIKVILHWHNDILKQKIIKGIFVDQNFKLLNISEKVIALSDNYISGSTYLTLYKGKTKVIPLYINKDKINMTNEEIEDSLKLKRQYENKIICFLHTKYVKSKELFKFIKNSKQLDDKYIILIGGEPKYAKKVKQIAEEYQNIIFLGNLDESLYKKYMYMCDIFCLPSCTKTESNNLDVLLAMYFAKPIVCYNILGSSVNYVNIDNQTGFEVKNYNFSAFMEAINKLSDEDLRISFGNNAKTRIEKYFTYENFKNNIVSFYESLEDGKHDN